MKPVFLVTIMTLFASCYNSNEDREKLYTPSNNKRVPDRLAFGKQDPFTDFYVYKFDTAYKMIQFYDNDTMLYYRAFFKQKLRHGTATVYFPDGKVMVQSEYKNDKQNGLRIDLDEKGDTISIEAFKDGIKVK